MKLPGSPYGWSGAAEAAGAVVRSARLLRGNNTRSLLLVCGLFLSVQPSAFAQQKGMGGMGVDPVITGQVELSVEMNESIEILLQHLIVEDPDSDYPDDFSLSVNKGPNHSVKDEVVTPDSGFVGTLIVPTKVDDGQDDPLHLVVEIKGYRRENAKEKKATMETYWVPGVNNLGKYGRWAFAEFTDVYQIGSDFEARVEAEFNKMIDQVTIQKE